MQDADPLRLNVLGREPECDGVISLVLGRADGAPLDPFLPGQYLTLRLDVPGQSHPIVRCYSLSHAPNGRTYRISVKHALAPAGTNAPSGVGSSYLHTVSLGDVISAWAPSGAFVLQPSESGPLVFLAGGIGVTPLLSMLEGLIASGAKREVQFVYGVRRGREHAFKARLEALAQEHAWLHLHVAYSRPDPSDRAGVDYRTEGRVTPELLQEVLPVAEEPYGFYLCAPAPMQDALTAGLEDLGVPASFVHAEAFGKASIKPLTKRLTRRLSATGDPIEVTFKASGKRVEWDPAAGNLLDFALSQEVLFPFACAAGHCGTCSSKLLSGSVAYPLPPQFKLREGQCLPCVALPTESCVLDR